MKLKGALQAALDFENKGAKIYESASEKSSNEIVKRTFGYLAGQELRHAEAIREFMKKESPDVQLGSDKPEDVKRFFNTTTTAFRKKTELSNDDIKAHEAALELEKNSYEFYKEQLGMAKGNAAKRLFSFLMEQESSHYELIEKSYSYIKNPGGFYAEEEKWNFEGG